jgi:hypothetical protein
MRFPKFFATVLGASLLAAPAFAEPAAPRAAATDSAKAKKGARHEARLIAALKKEGISDAKAQRVVAAMKKFRTEVRGVRAEMKSAKAALKANQNDAAAKKRLAAAKQKIESAKQRRKTEVAQILTPAELAKVQKLVERKHGKGKAKGKRKQKDA